MMRGEQQPVVRAARWRILEISQPQEVPDDLLGEDPQLGVGLLRAPLEKLERGFGADPVDEHEHAFGLLDDAPGLSDLGDGFGDDLVMALLHRRRDVDVEAVGPDDGDGVESNNWSPTTTTWWISPRVSMMRCRVEKAPDVRRISSSVAATCP